MQPNILKETVRGIQPVAIEDELLKSREIFLTEEVNPRTASELIKQLIYLDREAPGEAITMYINSPGGDVLSGLAVYDCIMQMKSPVNTVCAGLAASMGAVLFLAGAERRMLKNSEIMIHDPSFSKGDLGGWKPREIQEKLDRLSKTGETLAGIIAERTGMAKERVEEKMKKDTYYTAEEALDAGIATKII